MLNAQELFPLTHPGGLRHGADHVPGAIRPFSSQIEVELPQADGKHDRQPTKYTSRTPSQTSRDGKVDTDYHNDEQHD